MKGEWWKAGDRELCETLVEIQTRMRADYATMLSIVSEAEDRGLAKNAGYATLSHVLVDLLRMRPAEARRCVEQAVAVTPGRMISGDPLAAPLPATGQAAQEGALDREHIAMIHKHVQALPGWVNSEQRATFESALVEQAQLGHAGAVDSFAVALRARLDQDGKPPSDDQWVSPRNELRYTTRSDGRTVGKFDLDTEAGALLRAVLSPLAKPAPAEDGQRDERSAAERQGDGFVDLLRLAATAEGMPSEGGAKPHVAVTVSLAVLEDKLGNALLDGAGFISAAQARYLACDARVIPMVLGSKSEPLDVGVPSYTVPAHMRRALVARDRGCAFPNCGSPASICHSHHIVPWSQGGATKIGNLVLICPRHHRLVHASEWDITIVDGHPEFQPPGLIDPQRRPRRNTLHFRLE